MAKKKQGTRRMWLVFLALPFLNVGYQIASPYFEETKKMKGEVKKLKDEIRQVKIDSLLYTDDWEKKLSVGEGSIAEFLPEQLSPTEILRYFATNFEKSHAGVQFTSIIPSAPTLSGFVADRENPNIKARVSRVQIKAKMPPQHLLSYLEYVENYKGLSRISELGFGSQGVGKNSPLDLEMTVELFLVPKEWLKKDLENSDRATASVEAGIGNPWFRGKASENGEGSEARKEVPSFKIKQIIGTSIVVEDSLYEEGEMIEGWNISKVDPIRKMVQLRKGKSLHKVGVP